MHNEIDRCVVSSTDDNGHWCFWKNNLVLQPFVTHILEVDYLSLDYCWKMRDNGCFILILRCSCWDHVCLCPHTLIEGVSVIKNINTQANQKPLVNNEIHAILTTPNAVLKSGVMVALRTARDQPELCHQSSEARPRSENTGFLPWLYEICCSCF